MSNPNPFVAEVSNATARELVLAKAQAEHGGYDGCFERIADWWAQEQWERESQPQEFPHSDYEDAAAWVVRARAGLVALDAFDDPDVIAGRRVLPQVGNDPSPWVYQDGERWAEPSMTDDEQAEWEPRDGYANFGSPAPQPSDLGSTGGKQ